MAKAKPKAKVARNKRGSVRAELMRLYRAHGQLTPERMVEAARNPASPLHKRFEWSDTAAAEKWRLHQARMMLITVRFVPVEDKPRVRAVVNVREAGAAMGRYMPVADAMADPRTRKLLLGQALRELQFAEERYGHLTELAAVWRELRKVA